jgi:dolichyl-phosphate beta-glucosyltransferase
MPSTPFLSVVIPSYNEMKNLKRGVLDEVVSYLEKQEYSWEVVLSDDGSTDGTPDQLDTFAAKHDHVRVLHNPHAGKGPTVQTGMLAATGEWRLFTDFDQSTPISEIEKLLVHKDSHQVIIGSREITGALRDKEPWYRHIMGKVFNMCVQILAIPGIYDTQCGFKLFSAKAAQQLFSALVIYGRQKTRSDAFTGAFDVEALYIARKIGYTIKEVPILWHHHETDRVSPVKDSVRMLKDIMHVRIADLQKKYTVPSAV